jgi:UPF0716 family protein affecting phage T7 exclusion
MFRDLYYTLFEFVRTFGALQLFFLRLIMHAPTVLWRRFGLVVGQVYNAGALSLVIIMICGFFVGAVLGLQGFSNLSRFNAEDSVGAVAALALVKELGPVITALLFAGRAGTALSSEIGLIDPARRRAALPRRRRGDAAASGHLQHGGPARRTPGVRIAARGRCRFLLAADAAIRGSGGHQRRHHQERRVRDSGEPAGRMGRL